MLESPSDTGKVYFSFFNNSYECLSGLLDKAELTRKISDHPVVLIKPNLVESFLPPITTPVGLIESLVRYLQKNVSARIIIGEGTGALNYDTWKPFQELGYSDLASRLGVELLDLNETELVCRENKNCRRWPKMYLPKIVYESFLISVPVLKAHSLAGVTLTMKNMMGCVPPSHYRQGNSWKKSAFHDRVQEAVADLNRYRTPDFSILDATVGMPEAHLWGPSCDPPVNILAASGDPVALDAYGAGLLGLNWRDIGHILQVHGELGQADPLETIAA